MLLAGGRDDNGGEGGNIAAVIMPTGIDKWVIQWRHDAGDWF